MLSVDFVSKRLLSSACFSPNFGWPSNKHPTNKVLIQAPNHGHLRFHCYFILRGLGTGSRMAVLHQQSPAGAPCLKSTDLKRAKRVASPLFSFSFSSFSLRYSDFQCPNGVQEDSWGEILFSISDLSSRTLFLSLSGMPRHSPFSSQNCKPTPSFLPTDLSLSFLFPSNP